MPDESVAFLKEVTNAVEPNKQLIYKHRYEIESSIKYLTRVKFDGLWEVLSSFG